MSCNVDTCNVYSESVVNRGIFSSKCSDFMITLSLNVGMGDLWITPEIRVYFVYYFWVCLPSGLVHFHGKINELSWNAIIKTIKIVTLKMQ
jgi:hypothetical protein